MNSLTAYEQQRELERVGRIRARVEAACGSDLVSRFWDDAKAERLIADAGSDDYALEEAEIDIIEAIIGLSSQHDAGQEWWETLGAQRVRFARDNVRDYLWQQLGLSKPLPAETVAQWIYDQARTQQRTGDRLRLYLPRRAYPADDLERLSLRARIGKLEPFEARHGFGGDFVDAYAGRYLHRAPEVHPLNVGSLGVEEMGELYLVAESVLSVRELLNCPPQHALLFLLADEDVVLRPITLHSGPFRLHLDIADYRVPAGEVSKFYTRMSSHLPGRKMNYHHRPREKTSAMIRFVLERYPDAPPGGRPFKNELYPGWDKEHPWPTDEKSYPNSRAMASEFSRSTQRKTKGGETK